MSIKDRLSNVSNLRNLIGTSTGAALSAAASDGIDGIEDVSSQDQDVSAAMDTSNGGAGDAENTTGGDRVFPPIEDEGDEHS